MPKINVDFRGVESGGGRTRVPEDDYRLKCVKVELTESKSSGNPMLVWDWEISAGKFKGKKLRDRSVLTKEALWKLKQILEAMGMDVPSKKVALNTEKYIGQEVGATVIDNEYEGRVSSQIADYVTLDVLDAADEDEDEEEDDDEEEEEEPQPKVKKGKKGKKAKKPADDDDDEIEELDLDNL